MTTSEAFWEVFKATGHVGAYLLYKQYSGLEKEGGNIRALPCPRCLENARAE